MRQKELINIILIIISGLLIPFTLAPYNLAYLAFLPPLIFLYICNNTKSIKLIILYGYLFGISAFSIGVSWVYISIHKFGNTNWFISATLTGLFIIYLAIFPALKAYIYKKCFSKSLIIGSMLGLPLIWIIIDWLQGWLLTGFPWLYLGYSQINTPLGGFAPIISVYGISFIILMVSGIIYNIFTIKKFIIKFILIIFILAIFILGAALKNIPWTHKNKNNIKITTSLIQGNIEQSTKWQLNNIYNNINVYLNLTEKLFAKNNQLIVWPENAISLPLPYSKSLLANLAKILIPNNSTLILGIPEANHNNSNEFYNSIYTIGKNTGNYYKTKLVPFGEYLPLSFMLKNLIGFFNLPMSNFIPANNSKQSLLNINKFKLAPFICYEIAYPNLVNTISKNANFLLTISNDTWFGKSIGPHQHLQIAQMRALETGKPLIRATNSGMTGFINNHGKIYAIAPQFKAYILTNTITPYSGTTPLSYLTPNGVIICAVILLLILLILLGCTGKLSGKTPDCN